MPLDYFFDLICFVRGANVVCKAENVWVGEDFRNLDDFQSANEVFTAQLRDEEGPV